MMPGVTWLFFRDIVYCLSVFHLVCVPWLRVRSVAISCLLLLIHFIYSSPFPAIRLAIFLHYFEEPADCLRWASLLIFSTRAQVHSLDCSILCSATFAPLARSLMMRSRYSCRVMLPCFRLWKSHDVTLTGLTARKLAFNSDRSWLQDRMDPEGMFVYQRWARAHSARMSAFALHAEPPPAAYMVASYLSRNSFGLDLMRT
jgi:hypothetical protein